MEFSKIVSIGAVSNHKLLEAETGFYFQGLHLETETRFHFQIPHIGNGNAFPFPKNENRTVNKRKQKYVSNSSKHVMEEG
jgi:hypothetical protein